LLGDNSCIALEYSNVLNDEDVFGTFIPLRAFLVLSRIGMEDSYDWN
jgi:hypothetical protein